MLIYLVCVICFKIHLEDIPRYCAKFVLHAAFIVLCFTFVACSSISLSLHFDTQFKARVKCLLVSIFFVIGGSSGLELWRNKVAILK